MGASTITWRDDDMTAYDNLIVEPGEGFTTITINRPRVLNALSRATINDLHAACRATRA